MRCMGSMRNECIASDWQIGLASNLFNTSTNWGLVSLWTMAIGDTIERTGSKNQFCLLEFPQCALLVQLVGTISDVHFKILCGVFQKNVTYFADKDTFLPTFLEVS